MYCETKKGKGEERSSLGVWGSVSPQVVLGPAKRYQSIFSLSDKASEQTAEVHQCLRTQGEIEI